MELKKRPRLFLDIDGVFLAFYGNSFQMRPYAGTFLRDMGKHFDLYWLTCHGPKSTKEISHLCNMWQFDPERDGDLILGGINSDGTPMKHEVREENRNTCIKYAHWRNWDKPKEENLDKLQGVIDNGGLEGEWFVLEDGWPCAAGAKMLIDNPELGKRWIRCPQGGSDVLIEANRMFTKWVQTGKIESPWDREIHWVPEQVS